MDHPDEHFMQRCFDLARLGAGATNPNPMVGAVLVHNNRIIGEGYHRAYGQAHAEVNAVKSVRPEDRALLQKATLYVSLEPCNIHRNTPPCTSLILEEGIPRVVVASKDYTPGVNGSGLDRLRKANVEVKVGVLEEKGRRLSRPRNTFVTQDRPYILLKYAQSANCIFSPVEAEQLWLTNPYSKRLVHQWRSEMAAIMVGANTALTDNPLLTNRMYFGKSPVRVLLDLKGNLPENLQLFEGAPPTLLFRPGTQPAYPGLPSSVKQYPIPSEASPLSYLLKKLNELQLSSLMVEGGINTLRQFIQQDIWDEARVLTAPRYLKAGRLAPVLPSTPSFSTHLADDRLDHFFHPRFR